MFPAPGTLVAIGSIGRTQLTLDPQRFHQARTANLGSAHGGDIDNVQRFPSLQAAATLEGAHSHLGTGSAHS